MYIPQMKTKLSNLRFFKNFDKLKLFLLCTWSILDMLKSEGKLISGLKNLGLSEEDMSKFLKLNSPVWKHDYVLDIRHSSIVVSARAISCAKTFEVFKHWNFYHKSNLCSSGLLVNFMYLVVWFTDVASESLLLSCQPQWPFVRFVVRHV